jgi:hypothetical protein
MRSGWRSGITALLAILVLLPSAWLFWQARSGTHLGRLQDDGLYWTTARSIATGHAYRIASLPGQPFQTKYPPLYPLLLAGIWRLNPNFPANLQGAAALNWLAWLAYLAVSALLFRKLLDSRPLRTAGIVLLATNACSIFYASQIMAEPLFAALLLGAILLATKATESSSGRTLACFSALLAALAFLTKTAALPLLVTTPIVFACRRQYNRASLFFFTMAPVVAAWMFWSSTHRIHTSDPVLLYYTDYFGFYRATMSWRLFPKLLLCDFADLLRTLASTGPGLKNTPVLAATILGIMCLMGAARYFKRTRLPHLTFFAAAFTAQQLIWNFPPDERLFFPLVPLSIAIALTEGRYLWHTASSALGPRCKTPLACTVISTAAICFITGVFWQSPTAYNFVLRQNKATAEPLEAKRRAYTWFAAHAEPCSTLVAYDDPAAYLYTGHPALRNETMPQSYLSGDRAAIEGTISHLANFARAHEASYILWAPDDYSINRVLSDTSYRETLLKQNEGLTLVYSQSGVRIYSVQHTPDRTLMAKLPR